MDTDRSGRLPTRLNAFTDAAFAFALTLLIVTDGQAGSLSEPVAVLRQVPSYLMAFSLIAMFWWAHVSWSRRDGAITGATTLLTLALIFLVLLFVYPLRTMAQGMLLYIQGVPMPGPDAPSVLSQASNLFIFYGIGFAGMSAAIAGLHAATLLSHRHPVAERASTFDEVMIWSGIAITGLLCSILAIAVPDKMIAPWAFWLIPFYIGGYHAIIRAVRRRSRTSPSTRSK